jgi:hypothetical protein
MEGCPASDINILYLILSALVGLFMFLFYELIVAIRSKSKDLEHVQLRESMQDQEFHQLQVTLYGEKALRKFNHVGSSVHSKMTDKTAPERMEEA